MDQFPQDDRDDAEPDYRCTICGGCDGEHDSACPECDDETLIARAESAELNEADAANDEAALRRSA